MSTPTYNPHRQSEPWKNQVARDLNRIGSRIDFIEGNEMDESDVQFCAAARAIILRVAEFEKIETI